MSLNPRYIWNEQVICYDMFWKVVDSFKRLQVILYEIDAIFLELNENNFHNWFSLNSCMNISCQIVTETIEWKSIVTMHCGLIEETMKIWRNQKIASNCPILYKLFSIYPTKVFLKSIQSSEIKPCKSCSEKHLGN